MAALNTRRHSDERVEDKFLVPYEENRRFTGRVQFMETLRKKLCATHQSRFNHRVALYGMGGIGKTQCALKYVYSFRESYERVYWSTAVDQAALLSGYQTIAREAKLPGLKNANPIEIAHSAKSWLRDERSWLIVFDNLDDIKVADGLLPENGVGKHTLITTRNPKTAGIPAEPLEVPLLSADDCLNLLSTLSNINLEPAAAEYQQALEIVEELGYLPLAIEQAAAYVLEVTGDFAKFTLEYQKNRKEVSEWVSTGNRQYEHSVATTWSMSFHIARKDHPSAAKLLQLFAFLGILIEFLQAGVKAFDDSLRAVLSNQIEMAKALIELEKLSLIKWDRRNQSISIHRLVQAFIADGLSMEERMSTVNTIVGLVDEAFPKEITSEIYPVCRLYQSQVLEPLLRLKAMPSHKLSEIMVRVGVFLREDGKYYDSEKLLVEALQISTDILGSDAPETLVVMLFLAWTYGEQRRGDESIKLYETALQKRKKTMGEEHDKTLIAMHSLAWAYQKQGRNGDAIRLNEDVLEKRIRIHGDDHIETLLTKNNLGWMYLEDGRTEEAVRICQDVLQKRVQLFGRDHLSTLDTMQILASAYRKLGRTTRAAKLNKEVLAKRRRIQGEDHPETLTALYDLGLTFRQQGDDATALSLEVEVLEKRRKVLGNEHPDTLLALQHVAEIYRQSGRIAECKALEYEILEGNSEETYSSS